MNGFLNIRPRDLVALALVVIVGGGTWAYSRWDVASKRAQLEQIATEQRADMLKGLDPEAIDVLLEVDSDKMQYLFGKDWGLIRLYTRAKGDATMETFNGVEYFYVFETGRWKQTDTARIVLPEYIYEGYQKFEAAGHTVAEAAYERYSR